VVKDYSNNENIYNELKKEYNYTFLEFFKKDPIKNRFINQMTDKPALSYAVEVVKI